MANTVDIPLDSGWTLVSGPDTTGTFSIRGSGIVMFTEQSIVPVPESETGHTITEDHQIVPFTMLVGQSLYAKRITGNFIFTMTLK